MRCEQLTEWLSHSKAFDKSICFHKVHFISLVVELKSVRRVLLLVKVNLSIYITKRCPKEEHLGDMLVCLSRTVVLLCVDCYLIRMICGMPCSFRHSCIKVTRTNFLFHKIFRFFFIAELFYSVETFKIMYFLIFNKLLSNSD